MTQRIQVALGMRVQLRKQHPCGSDEWTITRTGADIGLACVGCGRRILLEREEFERRVKRLTGPDPDNSLESNTPTT